MEGEHAAFARDVEASQAQDPMPALEGLAELTGISVEQLVHHALVRWTREGAETLMTIEPPVLGRLWDAREASRTESEVGGDPRLAARGRVRGGSGLAAFARWPGSCSARRTAQPSPARASPPHPREAPGD